MSTDESAIPKLDYFKEYTTSIVTREGIICTLDWRYHSTARFYRRNRLVRIGYARLKECYRYPHFVPEWTRGEDLCRRMTKGDPLLKARWVIIHELTHAKLWALNYRDAHNKTFYHVLERMATDHLEQPD